MAERSKHTRGPWEVIPNYNSPRNAIMAGEQRVAVIGETSISNGDPGANARLIAAAPDYDDAARLVVGSVMPAMTGSVLISVEAFRATKSAIAKVDK